LDPSDDGAVDKNGFNGALALGLAGSVDFLYCTTNRAKAARTALMITRSSVFLFLGGVTVMPYLQ